MAGNHKTYFSIGGRIFSQRLSLVSRCVFALLLSAMIFGCNRNKLEPAFDYPDDLSKLMRKTCATKGCHDATSAAAVGGLNMESWATMFEGSRGGSPVVPYSPELSFLLYSINTDENLGPVLTPTMPYLQDPLTPEEYDLIWQWIDDGARNAEGEERFPPDPNRGKWYVGHNECDQVAVFDAESRQIMRYIDVGDLDGTIELVIDIEITPDGKDWFVVFTGTNDHIERYSTLTDEKVADITLGHFGWNTMTFSPDSRFAFVAGDYWQEIAVIDLNQNTVVGTPTSFTQEIVAPVVHPQRNQIYIAQHLRDAIYIMDYDNNGGLSNLQEIDLIQGVPSTIANVPLRPRDICFLPDGSKYFIGCLNTNEVRVFDGVTDSLLEVIALPANPGQLAYSTSTGRLFVSCMNDQVSWSGANNKMGSIIAIDANNHQILKTTYSGFQPYGIAVDDLSGVLVVSNRNTDPSGPAPHHVSTCGERNGYVTLIDLQSMELIGGFKPELLVDPVTVAVK